METTFLTNPINTVIICVTIILIVAGILYTILKRNIQFSKKDGFKVTTAYPQDELALEIPAVDVWLKNKLRTCLLDNVDVLFGLMTNVEGMLREKLLLCLLDELSQRIALNHLSKVLSDAELKQQWVKERRNTIHAKIFAHTSIEKEEQNEQILASIDKCLDYVVCEFTHNIASSCDKKILIYTKYMERCPERMQPLIAKNERYLEGLKCG